MDTPGGSGGGIGQAAGELMKEMQKAQAELQKLEHAQNPQGPNQAFQNAMQAQQSQAAHATPKVSGINQAAQVLLQAKVNANTPSTRVGAAAKAQRSRMAQMLEEMIGGQDKMTSIMKLALSGRQFNPTELLAMQAGVYRFTQELELTSKVIEKATSGIKQTMNTQV